MGLDYGWIVARERIARVVKYNPQIRISTIMDLARVQYAAVVRAISEEIIESDEWMPPTFTVTEKGTELLVK